MPIGILFWVSLLATASIQQESPASGNTFSAATFCNHIGDIHGLRCNEDVNRVNARRVVATVQGIKSFRNVANKQFVRNSVRKYVLPICPAGADESVAVLVGASCPQDAARHSLSANITKEAISQWNCLPCLLAFSGAESATTESKLTWIVPEKECGLAKFANMWSWPNRITMHAETP